MCIGCQMLTFLAQNKKKVIFRTLTVLDHFFLFSSDVPEEEKHFKIPTELIQHAKAAPSDLAHAHQVKIPASLAQQAGKLPTGKRIPAEASIDSLRAPGTCSNFR